MPQIELRQLAAHELERARAIDRTESADTVYRLSRGKLKHFPVNYDVEDDPDFWTEALAIWKSEVDSGASAFGAFDQEELVGLGIVKHGVEAQLDQVIALYVSAEYRLSGIARSLYLELERSALQSGAKALQALTTPTGAAVGFFLGQGFKFNAGAACPIEPNESNFIALSKPLVTKHLPVGSLG